MGDLDPLKLPASGEGRAGHIQVGNLALDLRRYACFVDGRELHLSPHQFRLLVALAEQPDEVVTHSELVEQVWGTRQAATEAALRKLVQRLRSRIDAVRNPPKIISVARCGYYLEPATNRGEFDTAEAYPADLIREDLYRGVLHHAARHGFNQLTIDDIASACLRPRGVVQQHVGNIDAFANEAIRHHSRSNLQALTEALSDDGTGGRPMSRIIELILAMFGVPEYIEQNVGHVNLRWFAWAARNRVGREGFRELWQDWRDVLMEMICLEVGTACSERTAKAIASLILAIYNGMLVHSTIEREDFDIDAIGAYVRYGWDVIAHEALTTR